MIEKINLFISKLDRSDRTKETYLWALLYFTDVVGDASLDVDTYEKFLVSIKDLSPSTKRVMRSAVMRFYDYYDAGDPVKMKKLNNIYSRKAKRGIVKFNREAVEKIIAHCLTLKSGLIELRDKAFVLMLADSGFRISELASLKRGDIEWLEQVVTIEGKGEKTAAVNLSIRSLEALREYLVARQKMDGKSGKPINSLPLFAQHGRINFTKAMTIDGMRQSLKVRMQEAGARVRVHDFRHYFVTMIVVTTGNLKLAQELARHESSSTTQGYAHFSNVELKQAYDEIFNN